INEKTYVIPMVIEESSVVAAASKAAKFWEKRGGFKTRVISTVKNGQVHFMYAGDREILKSFFSEIKSELLVSIEALTENMRKRGGGLKSIELIDKTTALSDYYQLDCRFETRDAMGANFINSCLEKIAESFKDFSDG